MSAGLLDITIEQGATFFLPMSWTDSNDAAIDLTGFTARMQVRRAPSPSESIVIELTTENNRIALGGTGGTIDLLIDAEDTAKLSPDEYFYDLEMIQGEEVRRLLEGKCIVTAEVTR